MAEIFNGKYSYFQVLFAQQLFHKKRVKRNYKAEDKRITDELLNLWHEASYETPNKPELESNAFSDPQWKEEWYMVSIKKFV